MDNFGFIHGELDTKILILFILRRLPRPVDADTLAELCFCDTGRRTISFISPPDINIAKASIGKLFN